jgi:hypothetical protein
VALFDHEPRQNDQALDFQVTDGGHFDFGPLDAGTYWLYGVYSAAPDAGDPVLPDGGIGAGYVLGESLHSPLPVLGPVTEDLALSPLTASVIALTVNASDVAVGTTLPPGGIALPDGGELYPLLALASVGGVDPLTGLAINDATAATVDAAGTAFSLGYNVGQPGDADHERYSYKTPLQPVASWRAAADGTYVFSVAGSRDLGATVTRQIDVHPLTGVPLITNPAPGSTHVGSVDVGWAEAPGATGASIKAIDTTDESTLCELAFPQTTPVTLDASRGCVFVTGRAYRIEVYSARFHSQPQGATFEAGYARVRVNF